MKITIVAGARPNFMKIAPIIEAIDTKNNEGYNISYRLVHTGQHYDKNLSGTFFNELGIPHPDINLEVKSGTQAEQTAAIMIAFENDLRDHPTDLIIVVGDVTSTMACSIVAKKELKKLAHVEAGIRSNDLTMPEEINRMVTDCLADYFFTTTQLATNNLKNNGVPENNIFLVGNVMIDTLKKHEPFFKKPAIWSELQLKEKEFLILTLHRPSNVDEGEQLKLFVERISKLTKNIPVIFPIHPRTKNIIKQLNIDAENLHFIEPLGYLEFNFLVKNSLGVITDSGGITEETTVMNIPCITLRENTERPETCELGTNVLVGKDLNKLEEYLNKMISGNWRNTQDIEFWDGHAANRIVDNIINIFDV